MRERSNSKKQRQDWLPASFNETGELAWYKKNFEGDQFCQRDDLALNSRFANE